LIHRDYSLTAHQKTFHQRVFADCALGQKPAEAAKKRASEDRDAISRLRSCTHIVDHLQLAKPIADVTRRTFCSWNKTNMRGFLLRGFTRREDLPFSRQRDALSEMKLVLMR
jgi:hypothetical protein